jgi:two-component system phosphate regulon response regulator OmpR
MVGAAGCAVIAPACRPVSVGFGLFQRKVRPTLLARLLITMDAKADVNTNAAAPPRVLVVDDDPDLRELLTGFLTASGFAVAAAGDGVQMRARIAQAAPDAIVLDLMLPGEDGLSLARELRKSSDVPILMLSARGEEVDRVVGLEVGADDYLAKPFSPRELLARLRALLRRARVAHAATPVEASVPAPYCFGPYTLDVAGWRLTRGQDEVALTTAEFELLRVFVEHPLRVLTRDNLIAQLKGYTRDAFDRSIDVRVTRLRRKIEADPAQPAYIRTVRGEGYLFNPRGVGA